MLSVQNINVYINKQKIVKDTSFKINPGEIVGLIGPNGAGKTTIMKTILGLTKFDGAIKIDQQTITENNHRALSRVGALIEHPAIYPFLTGRQNLILYSHDKTDMQQLISTLTMDGYIDHKAKGYSLGMKQKLGIAIALLNKPQLVILDEPMNGLDVEATITIRKIIQTYATQGTAFLISSHILSELQKVMTQILLINHGKIIVDQPINQFNRIHHQDYKLLTDNHTLTATLLKTQGLHFSTQQDYFLIKKENIYSIQDMLYKNSIHLRELAPIEINFEKVIVAILKEQRVQADEK